MGALVGVVLCPTGARAGGPYKFSRSALCPFRGRLREPGGRTGGANGGEARAPWDLRALSGGPGSTWARGGPGEARSLHTRLLSNCISSVTT